MLIKSEDKGKGQKLTMLIKKKKSLLEYSYFIVFS